jgi:hypothetical protein
MWTQLTSLTTADLVQSKKKFIGRLKSALLEESFYSANHFFLTTVGSYEKLNGYDKYTIHNDTVHVSNNILQIIYGILINQIIKLSNTDLRWWSGVSRFIVSLLYDCLPYQLILNLNTVCSSLYIIIMIKKQYCFI